MPFLKKCRTYHAFPLWMFHLIHHQWRIDLIVLPNFTLPSFLLLKVFTSLTAWTAIPFSLLLPLQNPSTFGWWFRRQLPRYQGHHQQQRKMWHLSSSILRHLSYFHCYCSIELQFLLFLLQLSLLVSIICPQHELSLL